LSSVTVVRRRPFDSKDAIACFSGSPSLARVHSRIDLAGLAANHLDRFASLSLMCPFAVETDVLRTLASRLLVITSDRARPVIGDVIDKNLSIGYIRINVSRNSAGVAGTRCRPLAI
jgi:hypothetical protein